MRRVVSAFLIACAAALSVTASAVADDKAKTQVATFASGCFWCTESDFDKVDGVVSTVSGFMGGHVKNPTYRQVVRGRTGHTEVLQVTYDPSKVSYGKLLMVYWRNIDPFDKNGQFCDRGSQYRPEIFAHTPEQEKLAKASKAAIISKFNFSPKIIVPVTKASEFTAAEEYHQNFYKKNPVHYWRYRIGCGRDARLKQIWGSGPKS